MGKKRYSKEELTKLLKKWVSENGKIPTKKEINADPNMPSDMAFRLHFGTWENALIESGFEPPKPFISEKCRKASADSKRKLRGKETPNWKGGKSKHLDGYVYIWNPERKTYEREHRLIMEEHIGRKLEKYEDVHHINGIKDDNRIENLMLLSRSEHASLHEKMNKDKHKRNDARKCIYPKCDKMTSSKYCLCREHYKSQWGKIKRGTIKDMYDFTVTEFKHTDNTKKILSQKAKVQNRKNGKFASNNPELLEVE